MSFWKSVGNALSTVGNGLLGGAPGAILSLGTNLVGASIQNNMANKNMQAQNAWSEKMNEQQQQWQEEMWNKNNEYNSPVNQMNRLIEAGVNPNNAAGLVSGTASQSQMAQQPIVPNSNPMVSPNLTGNSIGDLNWEYDRKQKEAAAAELSAREKFTKEQSDTWREQVNADIVLKKSMSYLNKSQEELNDAQRKKAQYEYEYILPELMRLNKAEADNAIQTGLNLVEQMYLIQQEQETQKKQQKALNAAANRDNAAAGLMAAQTEVANVTKDQIEETTRGIKQENDLRHIKVDLSLQYGVSMDWLNSWERVVLGLQSKGMTKDQIIDWFKSIQQSYTNKVAGGRESRTEGPLKTMNNGVSTMMNILNPLVPLSGQLGRTTRTYYDYGDINPY